MNTPTTTIDIIDDISFWRHYPSNYPTYIHAAAIQFNYPMLF